MKALRQTLPTLMCVSFMLFTLVNSAFADDKGVQKIQPQKAQQIESQKMQQTTQSNPAQSADDDEINEAYMDKALHALIYGKTCEDKSDKTKAERIILPAKGAINASNAAVIDSARYTDAKTRAIAFLGEILHGGIYDAKQGVYMSANRRFSYALKNDSNTDTKDIKGRLEVKAICEKQGFTITNFSNGDFGLNLSQNPTKEVAIVVNFNNSMWRYTGALKDIAPYLARHILGDSSKQYAKISLITFSYIRVQDLGTFYDDESFANALSKAKGVESDDVVFNHGLIRAMQNFTKDNGLKKEIYLITNGKPGDMLKAEKMLALTQNLNANIVKNTKDNADNRVKIHTFALSKDLEFLKKVAQITGGTYNETNNVYDFKKQILSVSNDGKPFDMRELNNEIRPSKNHKIYDPDDPNKPKKKAQSKEK